MSEQDKDRIAKDIESLIELFNRSDWDEMHLKTDEVEVYFSNDPNAAGPATAVAQVVAGNAQTTASHSPAVAPPAATGAPVTTETLATTVTVPDGMVAVTAPNLGTFYRAPKPGAAPYVEVGQIIDPVTDVCLIEVMKLFTPVKAGVKGKVHEVCVSDGTMVEFGQVLVIIDPS